MRKILLVVAIMVAFDAKAAELSPSAKISVLTCGPGSEELYAAFGHSAFRVLDAANGIDDVYNYGVFDFSNPNFYLDFARGFLYYRLDREPFENFVGYYIEENRFVHEQVLNLNPEETQKLYDFLKWNLLPENRQYRYDYYYDNCATKIRDVLLRVFDDSLKFDLSHIQPGHSLRSLTREYVGPQPWGELGIDLCLGYPIDKKIPVYDYMFLPDFIESGFDHATFTYGENPKPLVKNKNVIFESREETTSRFSLTHPLIFSVGFFLVVLLFTLYEKKSKRVYRVFDVALFFVMGTFGLFLLLLWLLTDHWAAANNFNLLWALPLHLPMAIALIWKNPTKYFLWVSVLNLLLLLLWPWLPQSLPRAMFPIIAALALRAWRLAMRK